MTEEPATFEVLLEARRVPQEMGSQCPPPPVFPVSAYCGYVFGRASRHLPKGASHGLEFYLVNREPETTLNTLTRKSSSCVGCLSGRRCSARAGRAQAARLQTARSCAGRAGFEGCFRHRPGLWRLWSWKLQKRSALQPEVVMQPPKLFAAKFERYRAARKWAFRSRRFRKVKVLGQGFEAP